MADASYRYPLTRICLRTGSLTLPLNLLGVFPERGELIAYDTEKDAEFTLTVDGRSVAGLGPFFAAHDLDVNDEIAIRPLEDGRFALTATARPKRPDTTRPEYVGKLLDAVVEAGVAMSEAEIRALHPELPSGFPLRQALEREPRLHLAEGRWQPRPAAERRPAVAADRAPEAAAAPRAASGDATDAGGRRDRRPARAEAPSEPKPGAPAPSVPSVEAAAERRQRARAAQEAAAARAEVEATLEAQAAREAEILEMVRREELERHLGDAPEVAGEVAGAAADDDGLGEVETDAAGARRRTRERLARHAEDDARQAARDRRREAGEDAQETFSWDLPTPRGFRLPWARRAAPKPAAPKPEPVNTDPFRLDRLGEPRPVDRSAAPASRVTPTPRAGLFPADAGLNSATLPPGDPAKTKQAREAFARLGYRVEGLAHGQLMLHADLGRRQERVLVHVLPDGQRLDWAALLARRREAGAQQLAVVGDHRDLHRLVSPAELAKATLWSWAGLERVVALAADLPIGPFDLEPHFERDGLFEYGLERFERSVARRVQERGTFSSVLERLAALKAPSIFVLDDVVGDGDVPRDQALRVLERLGEAPLHLVSRVDSGEFCLRYRVQDALEGLADYATSLRARLPERHRARVQGVADDVAPIGADELERMPEATAGGDAETQAPPAQGAARELVPVRATGAGVRAQRLPFAGPGLGVEDEDEDDGVDVALLAGERERRRD